MAGEPSAPALSEARLEPTSCGSLQRIEKQRVAAMLKQMRADVDASYHEWARERPVVLAAAPLALAPAHLRQPVGDSIGDAYGAGGLGLSGVGRGGGGTGNGIGLGSVGTIGHGAGFGSGHGRARAAHSVSHTNNQVAGVDEADIVKTDGKYVYLAMNGALQHRGSAQAARRLDNAAAGSGARDVRTG